MIVWDGCDDAIIGYVDTEAGHLVVYGYQELVAGFVRDGMSEADAVEWVQFNIVGAYLGERTPLVLYSADRDMIDELQDE